MRNKIAILIYFASLMSFASCNETGLDFKGTVTAYKDTSIWSGEVNALFDLDQDDSLAFIQTDVVDKSSRLDEVLSFDFVPLREGTYPLYPGYNPSDPSKIYCGFDVTEGGDVFYRSFTLDTTKVNYLTVESYIPFLRKITISFQASFIDGPHQQFEETKFTLSEGKIEAIVQKE